jgi:hypothetical protein
MRRQMVYEETRKGASSARFRGSGSEVPVQLFADDEHGCHPHSILLEAKPARAWREWGFIACRYTGEPGQRKQADPSTQASLDCHESGLWTSLVLRHLL